MANFLLDPGSLTQRLKAAAKKSFAVKVVAEGFISPSPKVLTQLRRVDKASVSECVHHRMVVWCREVALCVDGEPWVFAKTYIPLKSLRGKVRQLLHLGTRPLGEALFKDPHLQRSAFVLTEIDGLLTRSSVFCFYGESLLVTEAFLPLASNYFQE